MQADLNTTMITSRKGWEQANADDATKTRKNTLNHRKILVPVFSTPFPYYPRVTFRVLISTPHGVVTQGGTYYYYSGVVITTPLHRGTNYNYPPGY